MTRHTIVSRSLMAIALVALASGPLSANAQSRHGGGAHPGGGGGHGHVHHHHQHQHHSPGHSYRPGYWGPGLFWGGVGIGIGLGSASYYGRPGYYPGVVISEPPPVYTLPPPQPQPQAQALPVPGERGAPDPVIYPRTGQSPAQTEADRQDCNRWATTVPSAMADASVFNRATAACMDGRGYTLR